MRLHIPLVSIRLSSRSAAFEKFCEGMCEPFFEDFFFHSSKTTLPNNEILSSIEKTDYGELPCFNFYAIIDEQKSYGFNPISVVEIFPAQMTNTHFSRNKLTLTYSQKKAFFNLIKRLFLCILLFCSDLR